MTEKFTYLFLWTGMEKEKKRGFGEDTVQLSCTELTRNVRRKNVSIW